MFTEGCSRVYRSLFSCSPKAVLVFIKGCCLFTKGCSRVHQRLLFVHQRLFSCSPKAVLVFTKGCCLFTKGCSRVHQRLFSCSPKAVLVFTKGCCVVDQRLLCCSPGPRPPSCPNGCRARMPSACPSAAFWFAP